MRSTIILILHSAFLIYFDTYILTLGYKIIHLTLSLITIGSTLMIFLFCPTHQNMQKLQETIKMVDMPTRYLRQKIKKENRMFFLNVQIICEGQTFATSVYHKLTFNGVYTHFGSFLLCTYKLGTVHTLTYRFFRIRLSWTKLQVELPFLKEVLLKKWLP